MTKTTEDMKNARELLEVDVREVSLVDRPAIRREFLITKRKQEEDMGAFTNEDRQGVDPSAVGIAKDVNSGTDAGQTTDNTNTAAPAAPAEGTPPAEPTTTEPVDKAGKPEKKAAKPGGGGGDMEDEDVKVGPDGKPLPPFMQGKAKEKTQKNEDLLGELVEQIQKARSFTSPRIDQIKTAAAGLNNLLKTVDEGAFKAMLVDLKVLPANSTVDQAVKPTGVSKSETSDNSSNGDSTKVEALEKRLADTEAKLAEVLKARNPSTSIEGEGGGDNKTQEVKKNFWGGVL